ncbi:hypothetical protein Q5427_10865 [Brochothrix thermosphacta]|uniref:hypothetical protein n=1 Tax=Brochothrix thermosphacta TaxID=2756 RepID=UPI0027123DE6|nr:hypothetical protein [Brochothrix thermosphacta]MDO7864791.1 hypothetical protein [Brochothrix thermosphacta]
MIIKQKDGTVLEMTPEEFAELGGVLGAPVKVDALAKGSSEVATVFKVGELFEVVCEFGYTSFAIGTIVRMVEGYKDSYSSNFEDVLTGKKRHLPYYTIKRHTPEVLSKANVEEGEYFVVTDTTSGHMFKIGDVIKSLNALNDDCFSAERIGNSYWWWAYILYTNVRRATAEEIAEATKLKEVKFEVGDVVESGGLFAKIFDDFDSGDEYHVGFFKNGCFSYLDESDMRHATDEEKSHLQTLIGREKDEYKIGDLVELLGGSCSGYSGRKGYIFEIDGTSGTRMHLKDNGNKPINMDTSVRPEELKLITPVEWRHDFVEKCN